MSTSCFDSEVSGAPSSSSPFVDVCHKCKSTCANQKKKRRQVTNKGRKHVKREKTKRGKPETHALQHVSFLGSVVAQNFTSTPAFLSWKCLHNFCCCQNQLRPNTHDLLQHLSKPVFFLDTVSTFHSVLRTRSATICETSFLHVRSRTYVVPPCRIVSSTCHAEYALSTSTPHACAEEECRTIGAVILSYTVASGVNDDSVSSLCKLKTQ